jgi:hypothetical protein
MNQAFKVSMQVYDELSAKNESWKKVYADYAQVPRRPEPVVPLHRGDLRRFMQAPEALKPGGRGPRSCQSRTPCGFLLYAGCAACTEVPALKLGSVRASSPRLINIRRLSSMDRRSPQKRRHRRRARRRHRPRRARPGRRALAPRLQLPEVAGHHLRQRRVCPKTVKALSGGKFEISVHAGGELMPAFGVVDALQNGSLEMAQTAPYYFTGKDPIFAFGCAVPFGLTARQMDAGWSTATAAS